jgi:hypothetical protein
MPRLQFQGQDTTQEQPSGPALWHYRLWRPSNADAHKNKEWQPYAAATAAAVAKELLSVMPAPEVIDTPPASKGIQGKSSKSTVSLISSKNFNPLMSMP